MEQLTVTNIRKTLILQEPEPKSRVTTPNQSFMFDTPQMVRESNFESVHSDLNRDKTQIFANPGG